MSSGINPKWGVILNIVATISALIAAGTIGFVGIPPNVVEIIKTTALDLFVVVGAVNSVLHLYSSPAPGPLVNLPVPPIGPIGSGAAAVVKILLIAFVLSFFLAGGAHAQTSPASSKKCIFPLDPLKLCGNLTGNPQEDVQRVIARIQKVSADDLNYAILKATAANTNASKVRLQCLQGILAENARLNGANIVDSKGNPVTRPDPALATAIEDIAELVDDLSPQGALLTACSGAANLFKTNALAAVNGIVTGAVGLVSTGAVALP